MRKFLTDFRALSARGEKIILHYGDDLPLVFEPKELIPMIERLLTKQADAWVGISRHGACGIPKWVPLLKGVVIDDAILPGLPAELLLSEDGRSCSVKTWDRTVTVSREDGFIFNGLGYILREVPEVFPKRD